MHHFCAAHNHLDVQPQEQQSNHPMKQKKVHVTLHIMLQNLRYLKMRWNIQHAVGPFGLELDHYFHCYHNF